MQRLIQTLALTAIIAAFIAPGFGYVAGLFGDRSTISETENRALTPLPEFTGSIRDFTAGMDDYFEDNFGYRLLLIRLSRNIRDNLGENPPLVVYGKNDWLFLRDEIYLAEFEGRGDWTAAQVEAWIDSLSEMRRVLSRANIPFVAIVAPDKARVYPEYLPDDWTPSTRRFRTALHNHPRRDNAGLFDVEPVIFEQKDQGVQVYFVRDTHWTANTVYPVVNDVLDRLDPTQVHPRWTPREPRRIPYPEHPDLDMLLNNPKGLEPLFDNIGNPRLRGYTVTDLDPAGGPGRRNDVTPTIIVTDSQTNAPGTLVIVGDSFADRMIPHLKPSYDRIVRIYHGANYYRVGLADIMEFDPDAVLFVAAERNAVQMNRAFAPLQSAEAETP